MDRPGPGHSRVMDGLKTCSMVLLAAATACGPKTGGELPSGDGGGDASTGASSVGPMSDTTSEATSPTGMSASSTAATSETGESDSDTDGGPCAGLEAGVHCIDDSSGIECDGQGNVVKELECAPDRCVGGYGCAVCGEGQWDCLGDSVYKCDADADPPGWVLVDTCDPAVGEVCDIATGNCGMPGPVGGTSPTGEYFEFASFDGTAGFTPGYDVDSFEDRLYVNRSTGDIIDVYRVDLLDSDGDGIAEPNQHPDDPANTGVIEQRTLTFVESIPWGSQSTITPSMSELYVLDDRLFMGGSELTEYVFATEATSTVATAPGWAWNFSHIGYDDVFDIWYTSNEGDRRVMQYDASRDTWGIAFLYPELAGNMMNGLEVVTDPATGIPYTYVSDLTSDFLGQYRKDPDLGWQQENLFDNADTANLVQGMGFGAFDHFWATSGQAVFELGGGALTPFIATP